MPDTTTLVISAALIAFTFVAAIFILGQRTGRRPEPRRLWQLALMGVPGTALIFGALWVGFWALTRPGLGLVCAVLLVASLGALYLLRGLFELLEVWGFVRRTNRSGQKKTGM